MQNKEINKIEVKVEIFEYFLRFIKIQREVFFLDLRTLKDNFFIVIEKIEKELFFNWKNGKRIFF